MYGLQHTILAPSPYFPRVCFKPYFVPERTARTSIKKPQPTLNPNSYIYKFKGPKNNMSNVLKGNNEYRNP